MSKQENTEQDQIKKIFESGSGAETVKTLQEVARSLRVSVRTVHFWKADGMPVRTDGLYDLKDIQAWRLATKSKGKAKDSEWDGKYREYKARLAEMDYKKKKGDLIPIEEVTKGRVQRILIIKKSLLALPRRLAPQVVGLDIRAAEEIIEKRVKEIITEFSDGETEKPKE